MKVRGRWGMGLSLSFGSPWLVHERNVMEELKAMVDLGRNVKSYYQTYVILHFDTMNMSDYIVLQCDDSIRRLRCMASQVRKIKTA